MATLSQQLSRELEEHYFLVKKSKIWYFLGGAVAAAIAVIGLSYASAVAAARDAVGKGTLNEIEAAKSRVIAARDETEAARDKALKAYPTLLEDVPNIAKHVKEIDKSVGGLEAVVNRPPYHDLNKRDLGSLPLGDVVSQTYSLPASVPRDAKEILVYAYVRTGVGVAGGDREFHIFTEGAPPRESVVGFWLYVYPYPDQNAYSYNSQTFWLPVVRTHKINADRTGPNMEHAYTVARLYLLGYR